MDKPEEKKVESTGRLVWLFCMRGGGKLMVEIPWGKIGPYGHADGAWSLEEWMRCVVKESWVWVIEEIVGGGPVLVQISEIDYVLEINENDVLMMLGAGSKAFNKPSLVTPGKRTH
jgi:hypothetical protein